MYPLACSTLGQLQSGEVRLRTRVLESERADRRQAVLQGTTVGAVGAAGLANIVRPQSLVCRQSVHNQVPVLLSVSC